MFYAAHKHEHSNAERARMAQFVPAQQEDSEGHYTPAVALTAGGFPKFVLPMEEAVRLAHELVDLIEYAKAIQGQVTAGSMPDAKASQADAPTLTHT